MKIFLALLTISFVVLIHELGHFIVGLYLGAKPKEISIGFGKKLFQFKYKGIKLSFRWIFFGGFVSFHNHQFNATKESLKKKYKLTNENSGEVLAPWKWIFINLAGPMANVLYIYFAIFMLLVYTGIGAHTYKLAPESIKVVKSKIEEPLKKNLVIEFLGDNILKTDLNVPLKIKGNFLYQNNKQIADLQKDKIKFIPINYHFSDILSRAMSETVSITHGIFKKIWTQVTGTSVQDTLGEASGPASFLMEFGTLTKKFGKIQALILFSIIISLSLAFINMIPLPILDGGGFLFALIETLSMRRLPDMVIHLTTHASVILIYLYIFSILIKDLLGNQ